MKYARIQDNAIVEFLKPVDGFSVEECFHAEILEQVQVVEDSVELGASLVDGVWKNPTPVTTSDISALTTAQIAPLTTQQIAPLA